MVSSIATRWRATRPSGGDGRDRRTMRRRRRRQHGHAARSEPAYVRTRRPNHADLGPRGRASTSRRRTPTRQHHDEQRGSHRDDREVNSARVHQARLRCEVADDVRTGDQRADRRRPIAGHHLDDVDDLTGCAGGPCDVDDHVDRSRQLGADRGEWPARRGLHHERLEPEEGVDRAVGVARGQRTVVAGVHGLHQPGHLVAADLADHEPVGSQPQRGAHELVEGDRSDAVGRGRSGFEAHDVRVGGLQFGGVLQDDDALARIGEAEQATRATTSCRSTLRR